MKDNLTIIDRDHKSASVAHIMTMKNIIILSGRPGQGKTTFALSIAEKYYECKIYYPITEQDRRPEHFCTNFYKTLTEMFNKYSCNEFEEVMASGRFDPLESDNYLKSILKSLKKILHKKTVIILDNANLLPDIGIACSMVMSGLTVSGGMLNFIICSARNCKFPDNFLKLEKISHRFSNDFLNVTEHEFAELAIKMLPDVDLFSQMEQIMAITEGWITGICTIFKYISHNSSHPNMSKKEMAQIFAGYFNNIISAYTPKQFKDIMLLSLIDYFDLPLMQSLDPTEKMASIIHEMLYRNVFTQISGTSIRFHNLFKLWLRSAAEFECSPEEKSAVFSRAAEYEFSRNNLVKGFDYLMKSGNSDAAESFIAKNYNRLVTSDSPKAIQNALMLKPIEELKKNPWTALLFCHFMLQTAPESAKDALDHIYQAFSELNDTQGLLLACIDLIIYYADIKGDIKTAGKLYPTMQRLYAESGNSDNDSIIAVGRAVVASYIETPDTAQPLIADVLNRTRSETGNYLNITAYKTGLKCAIFSADKASANKYCDNLILKLETCALTLTQKLSILSVITHFTSTMGAHQTLGALFNLIRTHFRIHCSESAKVSALIKMATLNSSLSQGNYLSAFEQMKEQTPAVEKQIPSHLSSIVSLFHAMTKAVMCDDTAGAQAEEALKTRDEIGGTHYFNDLCLYMAGAVFTVLGNYKKADLYLHNALERSEEHGFDMISAACFAYLSYLHNSVGDKIRAREYSLPAVKLMQKTGITCFTILIPDVIANMCQYAMSDIAIKSFAAEIAFDRCGLAFDKAAQPIPVLNIRTLGMLEMSLGRGYVDCSSIGGGFRQMLAILLSSRGYSIDQETIQTYLWPESGKEQARRSFDNLLSRLRKILTEMFPGINPKNYIILSSGTLRLTNIRCDADEFIHLCRKAQDNYSRGEYGLATNRLIKAEAMFADRFFTDAKGIEEIEQKRRDVDSCFIIMLKLIQKLSFFLPDIFNPEKLYDRWLDIFMNETDVVLTVYKYYLDKKMTQKARNIIRDYTEKLQHDGYTDEEINELVFFIKTKAAS